MALSSPASHPQPPSGLLSPTGLHEIKHDGHRLIVRRDGETVRLFAAADVTGPIDIPRIATAAAKLRAKSFTLDGEAVATGEDSVALFDASTGGTSPRTRCCTGSISWRSTARRPLPLGGRTAKLAKLAARSRRYPVQRARRRGRRRGGLPTFGPRIVCTGCGIVGADARPNRREQPARESLTGAQCP
jgi:hypothetical protein